MTIPLPAGHHVVHIAPNQAMQIHEKDLAFALDPTCDTLASGHLMSVFSYDRTWNYQERHPDGDELVVVLSGRASLLLDQGDGEHATRVARGELAVVPAGAWHRVAVDAAATLLFVTPRPSETVHRSIASAG